MLNFSPIRLSDYQTFSDIFRRFPQPSTDYTFANLFAWRSLFHTQCALLDDTLFIHFHLNSLSGYMFPIGPPQKALPAVDLLIRDAQARNKPFLLKGLTSSTCYDLELAFPNRFIFSPDHDNDEYLYLTHSLSSLSGKKLQPKRNHINRFKLQFPHWQYTPIQNKIQIVPCIKMLNQYMHALPPADTFARRFDFAASRSMLTHFNLFSLSGAIISNHNTVLAFTIGQPLTHDTFVIHIEKALPNIPGAYSLINQQFAQHLPSHFTFINREEDMGLPNLRKAKLSYHPHSLLHHFSASLA
jgi:hypothetical protein